MATWLRQSTAIEIKLGPFVDDVDGFTAETGLTISQADVRLAKGAADWAQKSETTTLVHEENGWYRCLLDTTDTNTLGTLIVAVNETGALPVWREFVVVAANIFDSLVGGGDVLDVSTIQFNGVAVIQSGGRPEVNTTHVAGTAQTAGDIIGDTNDIQARLPATLTVDGNIRADTLRVSGTVQTAGDIPALVTAVDDLVDTEVGDIRTRVLLALPAVAPAANGGLPTVDASNYVAGIAGVLNQFDDLNNLSAAQVNAEVDTALDTAVPGSPTANSINERVKTMDDADLPGRIPAALVSGRIDASVGAMAANTVTAAALAADAGTELAAALLDLADGVETGYTLRQSLRIMAAALAGKASGLATTSAVFRNMTDSKDRITATVDADGNRTAVTLDGT